MAKSTPTIEGLSDTLRLQSQCSLIAPDDGCGNKSPTTFATAKMKFTIPFPNDNNATKGAYFSSSSSTPSATKTALKKRPSRVAKKTVSYCNTSDSELENDEDGYKLKKKAKANTTDSDSHEEATKRSAVIKPSATVKSSICVDERKFAAKPSTTGVVVELTEDKEKRATNKKIKEEVLQTIPQFKAVLSVPNAFRPEHWKVLLSQMENGGDYTNQLFFGQSRVSQKWRAETLVKAQAKLGIGIIRANVGGRGPWRNYC
jgi:hypothetical protein